MWDALTEWGALTEGVPPEGTLNLSPIVLFLTWVCTYVVGPCEYLSVAIFAQSQVTVCYSLYASPSERRKTLSHSHTDLHHLLTSLEIAVLSLALARTGVAYAYLHRRRISDAGTFTFYRLSAVLHSAVR